MLFSTPSLIALLFSLRLVSPKPYQKRDSTAPSAECQVAHIYQHPNASASYTIPAVELAQSPDDGFYRSQTSNWTISTALATSTDIYSGSHEPIVEQAFFLDTGVLPSNVSAATGLSVCSYILSLPESDIGKPDPGDCTGVLDEQCVSDLLSQVTLTTSGTQGGMILEDACEAISLNFIALPNSCQKFASKDPASSVGFSLIDHSSINVTQHTPNNCSTVPTAPINNFFTQSATYRAGDFTIYDQWAKTVTPVLLVRFSNTTLNQEGRPYVDPQLICTTPKNILAGSRAPPATSSATEPPAPRKVNARVAIALGVNMLLFFLL